MKGKNKNGNGNIKVLLQAVPSFSFNTNPFSDRSKKLSRGT